MNKSKRNYVLTVQTNDPGHFFINITLPFTIEFDVRRADLSSLNVAKIRIYNLNQQTRNRLLKDVWDFNVDRQILLQAGYGDGTNFPVIFAGNVQRCFSVREGVDFITEIEAFDGGFVSVNGVINPPITLTSGTNQRKAILAIINALTKYGLQRGAVGTFSKVLKKDTPFGGPGLEILNQLSEGGSFVDNKKINCLKDSECIRTSLVPLINADTGLLGTPTREQTKLSLDMLFEPNIVVGQLVNLQSSTSPTVSTNIIGTNEKFNYSGLKKVVSIGHRGTISEAVCGDAITILGLWAGPREYTPVLSQ